TQNHSVSTFDLVLISLTLVPTNSRNVPESLLSMPRTADESVKNRTPSISMRKESLIFWYSRTATNDPISSILGMEILHLGATLVFPAKRRQTTDPSSISHLK
ncbi:MAG: hypothetical protein ACK56F_20100, partial [bacterium]